VVQFLLALLLALPASGVPVPDPKQPGIDWPAYVRFVQALDKFDRKLAGCPEHYEHEYECEPARGIFDVKLWRQVQKLAPKGLALPGAKAKSPDSVTDSAPHE
jgi:hypothetical protein